MNTKVEQQSEAPLSMADVALYVLGAALIVGGMVGKMGWSFGWDALRPQYLDMFRRIAHTCRAG